MRRWILAVLIIVSAAVSHGYYHFNQYESRDGRMVPIPRKFDLATLPNKTVSYFITGQPAQMAENDSFTAFVSQIQLAARQWNDVDTSELRLQFGGFTNQTDGQSTPGIDILFAEIPPGVVAYGGPTQPSPMVISADGQFFPITRSQVVLPIDMTAFHSYEESIFLTIVHELGHALGLQHTLTNSVMSTSLTRTQTKGSTLGADDIAALSLLYPTTTFRSSLGTISGRVNAGNQGVPLANIVAISRRGHAISTLTAPDGTYRIEGIPSGEYYVYSSSLPIPQEGEVTPANIQLPLNQDGQPIQPAAAFDLLFWPGVRNHEEAKPVSVTAGSSVEEINLSITYRAEPLRLYNVLSYSFPGQVAVRPAHVNMNSDRNFLVVTGKGLMENDQPAPGLSASLLGGEAFISGVYRYYIDYLQLNLQYTDQTSLGKKHLVFSNGSEVYVAPGALTLTSQQPPQITEVLPLDNQQFLLKGQNLSDQTVVFFDGVPGVVQTQETDADGILVAPPAAKNGHRAALVAYNADGQNSLFLDGTSPQTAVLSGTENPSLIAYHDSQSPLVLPQGAESMIEIHGMDTNFQNGSIRLGFGTSDIVVKKIWVRSPTNLLAQIQVSPQAALIPVSLTLTNGLQQIHQREALWVGSPDTQRIPIQFAQLNPLTGVSHTLPGGIIVATLGDLHGQDAVFLMGDRNHPVEVRDFEVLESGQYAIRVPSDFVPGPVAFAVKTASRTSFWHLIEIDRPAPQTAVWNIVDDVAVEGTYQATVNEQVNLNLIGELDPFAPFQKVRVSVRIGEIDHPAVLQGNRVVFTVLPGVPEGEHTLTVTMDGQNLTPIQIFVKPL